MIERICENCQYWKQNKNKPREEKKDDDCPFDYHTELDEDYGQCRSNPPRVGEGDYCSMWPVTRKDDWCGIFVQKEIEWTKLTIEEQKEYFITIPPKRTGFWNWLVNIFK